MQYKCYTIDQNTVLQVNTSKKLHHVKLTSTYLTNFIHLFTELDTKAAVADVGLIDLLLLNVLSV